MKRKRKKYNEGPTKKFRKFEDTQQDGYFSRTAKKRDYEKNYELALKTMVMGDRKSVIKGDVRKTFYTLETVDYKTNEKIVLKLEIKKRYVGTVDEHIKQKTKSSCSVLSSTDAIKSDVKTKKENSKVKFRVYHKKLKKEVSVSTVYGNIKNKTYILNRREKENCPVVLRVIVEDDNVDLKKNKVFVIENNVDMNRIKLTEPTIIRDVVDKKTTISYNYVFNMTAKKHTKTFQMVYQGDEGDVFSGTITIRSYSEATYRYKIKTLKQMGYEEMIDDSDLIFSDSSSSDKEDDENCDTR